MANIHFTFSSPWSTSTQVETLLEKVLRAAKKAAFFSIDHKLKIVGPDDIDSERDQFPSQFFRHLMPTQRIGFNAQITRSVALSVSLFRYPTFRGNAVPWFSIQRVSIPDDLPDELYKERHGAVIATLDAIQASGMPIRVDDKTGYWDHRSEFQMLEVKHGLGII